MNFLVSALIGFFILVLLMPFMGHFFEWYFKTVDEWLAKRKKK